MNPVGQAPSDRGASTSDRAAATVPIGVIGDSGDRPAHRRQARRARRAAPIHPSRNRSLTGAEEAAPSPVGIVIAAASLVVMPLLSWAPWHRPRPWFG